MKYELACLGLRKPTIWVSDQVDTNQAVQPLKIVRSLKFRETWHANLCCKNKGTDQLCSYCTADLCLLFLHMPVVCFMMQGSDIS